MTRPTYTVTSTLWALVAVGVLSSTLMLACSEAEDEAVADQARATQGENAEDEGASEQETSTSEELGDQSADSTDDVENEGSVDEPGTEPLEGFGRITGACGSIDEELLEQALPVFIENIIDFQDDPYDAGDYLELTLGGQEIISDGNAGGSSLYSEVFAFEVLFRCEAASLLKTETEIIYEDSQGKMTDLLIEIGGEQVGVSVTRAVGFPREDPYTVERAQALLEQKLSGVLSSTANVTPADGWNKQILHVMAYGPDHAQVLGEAFDLVDPELKSNTIVYVTVSDGDDAFLY